MHGDHDVFRTARVKHSDIGLTNSTTVLSNTIGDSSYTGISIIGRV